MSHPAWVCGLKHHLTDCITKSKSHTLRGCVDWNNPSDGKGFWCTVTPCVGVWIETQNRLSELQASQVTPCVGVWIETSSCQLCHGWIHVTPCVGVWIETSNRSYISLTCSVTPCVGVWIETGKRSDKAVNSDVTPCVGVWIETWRSCLWLGIPLCHTLRGCVDWNNLSAGQIEFYNVTPCVGVWIETIPMNILIC